MGTADNLPCKFPFIYKDVTYYQCTKRNYNLVSGWQGVSWCATSLTSSGEYDDYGDCNDKCPFLYSNENPLIYWTYDEKTKTIRNQNCKYIIIIYRGRERSKNWGGGINTKSKNNRNLETIYPLQCIK